MALLRQGFGALLLVAVVLTGAPGQAQVNGLSIGEPADPFAQPMEDPGRPADGQGLDSFGFGTGLGPQGLALGTLPVSPVLTVDSERLFAGSRYGRYLNQQLEEEANAISEENRRLEAELAEEERALTRQRAGMSPQEFRDLADAFDDKVMRIRRERDERAIGFGQTSDTARRRFLEAAEPVLKALMNEAGAGVIFELHSVFVARDAVDITDEAIARIDATLLTREGVPEEGVEDGSGFIPSLQGDAAQAPATQEDSATP